MNTTPQHDQRLTIAHYFLFFLLFSGLFFCFRMIRPYLDPILFAFILAALTGPVYQRIKKKTKDRENAAAFLSCLLLTMVIIVPFMVMLSVIISQGIHSFNAIDAWINAGNLEKLQNTPLIAKSLSLAQKYIPGSLLEGFNVKSLAANISSTAGKTLVSQSGSLIGNMSILIGKFFLMIFVFFFAIKDQEKIYDYILHLVPLSTKHETILMQKIKDVAKSALLGSLVTAVAQGTAGGIAFAICGLPGFFWGAMMAFSSLIPVVGTALIWMPAVGYLLLSGHWGYAIFLAVWCVLVVGLLDNIVRPLFMKGGAGMSTILIFFAIFGGINYFGLPGLLYGPLIFGITMVLLYIYGLEFESFLKNQDQA